MKTSLKLKLNKDRILNSGKYPLVFQIIHRRQRRLIYTEIQLYEESFDPEKQQIISSERHKFKRSELYKINETLHAFRREIELLIESLNQKKSVFTADNITALYNRLKENTYFFTYAEQIIQLNKQLDKFGSANNYRATINVFYQYMQSDKLRFVDVTIKLLKDFEIFLQLRKLKQNSIAFYINNLRTLYNKAAEEGVFDLPPGGSPFDKVMAKRVSTVKRALPMEVVRRIKELNLSDNKDMELSRDIFMFSFYSRGMPLVDVLNLKTKEIGTTSFHYYRRKTKTLITVGITEQLQQLIDKYATDEGYVFPCLSKHNNPAENFRKYRNFLVRQNNTLKRIAELIGVKQNLTTYVARHSWATTAKEKGISIAVISEGLGHSTESVTNIYLKSFEQRIIDEANSRVSLL